jgi:signal peptidase I
MSRRRRGRRPAELVRTGVAVLILGLVVGATAWAIRGGRWYVERTPSMGTAAPVGTLLWVEPVAYSDIHVGDFITFRPPGAGHTYSHRVISIGPDGTLHTKGDANSAPDPWTLSRRDVVGKVVMRWWAVGWLVRAAPLLIGGALLLWLLIARWASAAWRQPVAIVGAAALGAVSIYLYRPLVGAERITYVPKSDGVQASFVSTGLLPLRLSAAGGQHVELRSGASGTVVSHGHAAAGQVLVSLRADVPWWLWVALFGACFAPAILRAVPRPHR